jgi:hypothetical protein
MQAAQKFSEASLKNIASGAGKVLGVFDVPLNTANIEAAIVKMQGSFKKVLPLAASIGVAFKAVFSGLTPHLAKVGNLFTALWKKIQEKFITPLLNRFKGIIDQFKKVAKVIIEWGSKIVGALLQVVVAIGQVVAGLVVAGGLLAATLAGVIMHMAGVGKNLDDVSRESGFAGDQILRVQYMLQRMGASAEDANGLLVEMRDNLIGAATGFGDAARWLALLNVNVAEIRNLNPSEQFETLADALFKIPSAAQRMTAANAILGSMGAKAVVLKQSGKDVDKSYGHFISLLAKAAPEMTGLVMAWTRLKSAGTKFFGLLSATVVPTLRPLIEKLATVLLKMADAGEKFGDGIAKAIRIVYNLFEAGGFKKLWEVTKQMLSVAFKYAVDVLWGSLKAIWFLLKNLFGQLFNTEKLGGALWNAFQVAVDFLAASLLKVFKFIANFLSASLAMAVDKFMDKIPTWMGGTKDTGLTFPPFAQYFKEASAPDVNSKIDSMIAYWEGEQKSATDRMAEAWKRVEFIRPLRSALAIFEHEVKSGRGVAAWAKLKEQLDKFDKAIKGMDLAKPLPKAGGPLRSPMFLNTFDELRRIGGGLGKQTINSQDRQLEYTRQIAESTRTMAGRPQPKTTGAGLNLAGSGSY